MLGSAWEPKAGWSRGRGLGTGVPRGERQEEAQGRSCPWPESSCTELLDETASAEASRSGGLALSGQNHWAFRSIQGCCTGLLKAGQS